MNRNFMALFKFKERWKHLVADEDARVVKFVITADIKFKSPMFDQEDESEVTITAFAGPNDGDIDISETHILNQNYLHLSYKEKFQSYKYKIKSGALEVTGEPSSKVGGAYKVRILPRDGSKCSK